MMRMCSAADATWVGQASDRDVALGQQRRAAPRDRALRFPQRLRDRAPAGPPVDLKGGQNPPIQGGEIRS